MEDTNKRILEKWRRVSSFSTCDLATAFCLENEESYLKKVNMGLYNTAEDIIHFCFKFIKSLDLRNIFNYIPCKYPDEAVYYNSFKNINGKIRFNCNSFKINGENYNEFRQSYYFYFFQRLLPALDFNKVSKILLKNKFIDYKNLEIKFYNYLNNLKFKPKSFICGYNTAKLISKFSKYARIINENFYSYFYYAGDLVNNFDKNYQIYATSLIDKDTIIIINENDKTEQQFLIDSNFKYKSEDILNKQNYDPTIFFTIYLPIHIDSIGNLDNSVSKVNYSMIDDMVFIKNNINILRIGD